MIHLFFIVTIDPIRKPMLELLLLLAQVSDHLLNPFLSAKNFVVL